MATPRLDGWLNVLTGIGTTRDKRAAGTFAAPPTLSQQELEDLYHGDDIIARICDLPAAEMTRQGIRLGQDLDPELGKQVLQAFDDLDGWSKISEAIAWARLYGGAIIILGADDGQSPTAPLNLGRLRTFDWLTVLDRHEADIVRWNDNPRDKDFGAPQLYRIQRVDAPGAAAHDELVHASRVLRFDGVLTSRRRKLRNGGWSDGAVTRVYNVVRDFSLAWGGTAHLLQDFSQALFTVRGLANMLVAHEDEAILKRFRIMDMARSIARAIVIDESESFDRKATPVAGLSDLLAAFEHRLAAAARMPVSLLMGEAPAGLNATGDSDIRWFYDQMAAEQERTLRPHVNRILECLFRAKKGPTRGREPANWSFEFNPLWQLDDLQQAELRHKQAQTDALYIQSGVLDPSEVASSRFGGDQYSTETVLDLAMGTLDDEAPDDDQDPDDEGDGDDTNVRGETETKAPKKAAKSAVPAQPGA